MGDEVREPVTGLAFDAGQAGIRRATQEDFATDVVASGGPPSSSVYAHPFRRRYHYDIPAELSTKPTVTIKRALTSVDRIFEALEAHELRAPTLVVYRYEPDTTTRPSRRRGPDDGRAIRAATAAALEQGDRPTIGEHFLAWDIRVVSERPAVSGGCWSMRTRAGC